MFKIGEIIMEIIDDIGKFFRDMFIICYTNPTALIVPVIILFLIFTLPSAIEEEKQKEAIRNCTHESKYLLFPDLDIENKQVVVECRFCDKIVRFNAEISYPEDANYPATCCREGLVTEYWTFEKFPNITYSTSYNTPIIPHIIGEIASPGVDPTCLEKGMTPEYWCGYCGTFVRYEVIDELGHDYQTSGYVAPTCTTLGKSGVQVCTRCGDSYGKDTELPLADHQGIYGTFEATLTNCGFKGTGCKHCGCPLEIDTYISDPFVASTFEYEELTNENAVIITGVKEELESYTFPIRINGKDVKYLADGLFKENDTLKNVELPQNLAEISNEAFYGCSNLESIVIPHNVTYIGQRAFFQCENLKFVDMGFGVEMIDEQAFYYCDGLLSVKFSPNLTRIASGGFGNGNIYHAIPVIYTPRYCNFNLPNYIHGHNLTDEEMIIEEDGYYYYIGEGEYELLSCDSSKLINNTVIIPEKTDIISDYFIGRVPGVTGMVLPNTVYKVGEQYIKVDNNVPRTPFTIYYLGSFEEYYFTYFGYLEPSFDAYYDVYFYGRPADEWGWDYDKNGVPTIKELY